MCSALLLSVAVRPVRCPPGFNSLCSVPPAENPEVMCLPPFDASAWFCFFFYLPLWCCSSAAAEIWNLSSSFLPFLFQAMKPTRTSSGTFHTWPQTTLRSSNAAVPTSDSKPPQSACVEQMRAHMQECLRAHFVLATCHMLGHCSAGVDSRRVKELETANSLCVRSEQWSQSVSSFTRVAWGVFMRRWSCQNLWGLFLNAHLFVNLFCYVENKLLFLKWCRRK